MPRASSPRWSWWIGAEAAAPATEAGPDEDVAEELGLPNPEIGVRLFISARPVKDHLGKVFAKLGISSRSQLDRVLADDPAAVPPR